MSGFDFLSWLRASVYRTVPVVMRSASENQKDVNRAYELGANSYMVKPVVLEEAEAQFKSLSRFWFQCCNLPAQPGGQDARRLFARPETDRLLAHLKVGFTAAELQVLEADHIFAAACGRAGDSPEDLSMLVKLGGAVLAARSGRESKFESTLPQCDLLAGEPENHSPAA